MDVKLIDISPSKSEIPFIFSDKGDQNLSKNKIRKLSAQSFMWFRVNLVPHLNGIYECLKAKLTESGDDQCKLLESHLKNLAQIWNDSNNIYAPLTSFIQSSGFGKTKICLELLKKHPGIYIVFRNPTDTGIPNTADWMINAKNFMINAPNDDLPLDLDRWSNCTALDYTPGRFLIFTLVMIENYYDYLQKQIPEELKGEEKEKEKAISKAISEFGGHFMNDPKQGFEQL